MTDRTGADAAPPIAGSPWWHRTALTGAVLAMIAWAVTLTYLTPHVGTPLTGLDDSATRAATWPGWRTAEGRLWMHELRLYAITCAVLCLLVAAAYRGRPLLPALGAAALLLTADVAVVRAGLPTLPALPLLIAGAVPLTVAAWQASIWLAATRLAPAWAPLRRPPLTGLVPARFAPGWLAPGWLAPDWLARRWRTRTQNRSRRLGRPPRGERLVAAVMVVAAFLIPGIYVHRLVPVAGVQTPPVLLFAAVAPPTVLAVLVGLGAAALSRRAGPARWPVVRGLGYAALIGGLLLFVDGVPAEIGFFTPGLCLPMVALAIVLSRPRLPVRPPGQPPGGTRDWTERGTPDGTERGTPDGTERGTAGVQRRPGAIPLLVALGLPVGYLTIVIAAAVGPKLFGPLGYALGFDGIPYVPGAILVAPLIALLTAARLTAARLATPTASPGPLPTADRATPTGRRRPAGPRPIKE